MSARMIAIVLLLISPYSNAVASNCPDFTGSYASEADQAWERSFIWTQTGCDSVTLQGRYTQIDGSVQLSEPVTYFADGKFRRTCNVCHEAAWFFSEEALTYHLKDVNTGITTETHRLTVNAEGIVDDYTWENAGVVHSLKEKKTRVDMK